ncbi:hypothetical protein [Glutamicibacter sp. M10]|uniref:hypothetical protein n=1 Tax=Glutamicibacter sp. M10 TaxID=3023076 RepID=UPI0021CACAB2|nr:hypothetical protein [Glutamicibacter sp. M10]UXN32138.1 hypothetical protein N6V40_01115 [Glutamicibacter sp. M10]
MTAEEPKIIPNSSIAAAMKNIVESTQQPMAASRWEVFKANAKRQTLASSRRAADNLVFIVRLSSREFYWQSQNIMTISLINTMMPQIHQVDYRS